MRHFLWRNARHVLRSLEVHSLIVMQFWSFVSELAEAAGLRLIKLIIPFMSSVCLLLCVFVAVRIGHEKILSRPIKIIEASTLV